MSSTETAQSRRRGLVGPWWRVRTWSRDLDTLIRLHRGLQLLDVHPDADAEHLPAPTLLAEPAELTAYEDGPAPQELPARPQLTPRRYVLELATAADHVREQVREPAAEDRQQTAEPPDASAEEAEPSLTAQAPPTGEDAEPAGDEPEREPERQEPAGDGPGPDPRADAVDGQPAAVPEQTSDAPDPAIAAIKATFSYVAEAGLWRGGVGQAGRGVDLCACDCQVRWRLAAERTGWGGIHDRGQKRPLCGQNWP